jgi:glycine/D-amino acid oxidase-like deaminating enzyme
VKSEADIIIIGAGIWGLSTAYHLAREQTGRSIVVVERNAAVADETTRQAAGQIGQLRSDPLMASAVGYTLDLLAGFKEATGHDPSLTRTGSLHLAQCDERMASFEAQLAHAGTLGIEAQIADGALIEKLAPAIRQQAIVGALYVPGDGYVDARACAQAYGRAAQDLGAEIILNAEVTDLVISNDSVSCVETSAGSIATQCVVAAAGPWAGRIAAMAGLTLPMQPIRLQQARTAPDPGMPVHHPVVRIPDQSCYLRPEEGGYLFGIFDADPMAIDPREKPANFATGDIKPEEKIIAEALQRLAPVFPVLNQLDIAQFRQGMITCTPDAGYVVGPTPCIAGLWIATGCGGMGIAGSGSVGRWLSDWILKGNCTDDVSPFAPPRFKGRDPDLLREECRHVYSNYYALNSVTYSLG